MGGTAVYVAVSKFIVERLRHRGSTRRKAILTLMTLAGLATSCVLALRVVVRVVETSEGRALEIVYGPAGVCRQFFGPDQLVAARSRNVSFLQTGGWGYRGNLRILRWAAVATRSGEALEVELTGHRRFIVTVDEPEDFVSALQLEPSIE